MKIYKFIIVLFLFVTTLFADIKLYISSNTIVKNEAFVFVLEVLGNDINFPNISLIDGKTVQEISSSTSTNIINGNITKKIKKTYSFYPTKDFILPSFKATIDGENYKTNEEKITILEASKTQSDIFDLNIKTNNSDLYIGENFILTMVFKYKKDVDILDLTFDKPNFENFWYKQIDNSKKYEDGDFTVFEIKFLMFALKKGIQKI
ncbi:MAG: BatD family protein, partial [Aliarcobacter sp.]|nr:BatD family protein [Aliarcobacter sp.]